MTAPASTARKRRAATHADDEKALAPGARQHPRQLPDELAAFARGTRSVVDDIAPTAIEFERDYLRIDEDYVRALYVSGLPQEVGQTWLGPLFRWSAPITWSMFIFPRDTAQMMEHLRDKETQLTTELRAQEKDEKVGDPVLTQAYEQVRRLRTDLQRGVERLFNVSIYGLLRAPAPAALLEQTRQVLGALRRLGGHGRVAQLQQDSGLLSTLPIGQDLLHHWQNIDTSGLALAFPFVGGSLSMDTGILYGAAPRNQGLVILDPFDERRFANANMAVMARSGYGKSYAIKLWLARMLGRGIDVMVIDPDNEYQALCEQVGGLYLRFSVGTRHHINPLDLPPGVDDRDQVFEDDEQPNPVNEQVARVTEFVAIMVDPARQGLTATERALTAKALRLAYAGAGIIADDEASHGLPAPLLHDVHAELAAMAENPVAQNLAVRMESFVGDGEYANLFDRPTDVALDNRCVVFSLQAIYEHEHLLTLAAHLIGGFVWGRVRPRHGRRPRILAIDEANRLIQHPAFGEFLAYISRRARKYWLGIWTISQNPKDFLDSAHGKIIVAQSDTKFVLRQDDSDIAEVGAVFDLTERERRDLLTSRQGQGYFFAFGSHAWMQVIASPAENRFATTAPSEVEALLAERVAARAGARSPQSARRPPPQTGNGRRLRS